MVAHGALIEMAIVGMAVVRGDSDLLAGADDRPSVDDRLPAFVRGSELVAMGVRIAERGGPLAPNRDLGSMQPRRDSRQGSVGNATSSGCDR